MKRILFSIILTFSFLFTLSASDQPADTTVYLITCASGNELYSLWGHSALRVVIPASKFDMVYNWGVFDFNTPNFAWKFAKGRLNYMLGVYNYDLFIRDYFMENRSVISQRVNLTGVEKLRLMILLAENMKPENRNYRYDFIYDNCSTRIRDILEKLIGDKLIYPPDEPQHTATFRDQIGIYTRSAPWTRMGIDLLVGTPADKQASFRGRMFLPNDLQRNLTSAVINRERRMVPLLSSSESLLEFPSREVKSPLFSSPIVVFSILFILLVFLSARYRLSSFMTYIDTALFLIFSILAVVMVFFSFFTDHVETRLNLNILWFNPFLLLCLWWVIKGKKDTLWFRVVFYAGLLYLPLLILFPGALNSSYLPVMLILLLRSSARAGFIWNPFSIAYIQKD